MSSVLKATLISLSLILSIYACPYLRKTDVDLTVPCDAHGQKIETKEFHKLAAVPSKKPTQVSKAPITKAPTKAPTSKAPTKAPTAPKPTKAPTKAPTLAPVLPYTPGVCKKLNGATLIPTTAGICKAYKFISGNFTSYLPSDQFALSDLLGKAVRLAFHDAGEADLTKATDTMGPDGCLSSSSDNAGLVESNSPVMTIMEPIWQQYCDKISRADFWALFGKLVVEYTAKPSSVSISYQYGRKDTTSCEAGAGRLPSAQKGLTNIGQVFVTQMGLTLNDAVTLLGAHTLGHVHPSASGYGKNNAALDILINAWDTTPLVFDNNYYISMIGRPWKNILNNPVATPPTANLFAIAQNIMLNADMALGFPAGTAETVGATAVGYTGQICGPRSVNITGTRGVYGCTNGDSGVGQDTTKPSTFALVDSYSKDNALFLSSFATSYVKMMSVGYGIAPSAAGKLGSLTSIDLSTC